MGTDLNGIVSVTISKTASNVSQDTFDVGLIAGVNKRLDARVKEYSSISAVSADFASTDAEYLMATAYFAQNPRPSSVKIGRCVNTSEVHTFTIANAINNSVYALTINGTTYSYTSDGTALVAEIHAGLVAAIGSPTGITVGGASPTITLTATGSNLIGAKIASTSVATGITEAAAALSGTVSDSMDTITAYDNDWYGLLQAWRDYTNAASMAYWAQSNSKWFVIADDDSNILSSGDTTSIAYTLKGLYDHTVGLYSGTTNTQCADGAFLGRLLPLTPGTWTGKFKTLAGVTADSLTESQQTIVRGKYFNTYTTKAGKSITESGVATDNSFIDLTVYIDYLKSRVQTEIYSILTRNNKLPYTVNGVNAIKAAIEGILKTDQRAGILSENSFDDNGVQNGGFYVEIPAIADISTSNKSNRVLPDVRFVAWYSGAIHSVQITGEVIE